MEAPLTGIQTVRIADLMASSGVQFGTSGARGLVSAMTDAVCYAYTLGFIRYLERQGRLVPGAGRIALGGDLRPSTPRILSAAAQAVADAGHRAVHCGRIPSPALALYGFGEGIPSIMVTGSHIPDDRNGIKFTTPSGEILKRDEEGIRAEVVELPDIFDANGCLQLSASLPSPSPAARERYVARWLKAFPRRFLAGRRLGLYEHSAVGRDLLARIYQGLGAELVRLGRSERFIPVDTEAIRPEDEELAAGWARQHRLDAILSTDGDSDRPLISDEKGRWLRGDVAGILCARYFGADVVVTPVSSNSALELSGWFKTVRTKIGSPYVIEGMMEAARAGSARVVGYEANGGFLSASPLPTPAGELAPLPTRDAVIVHLGVLGFASQRGATISKLTAELPPRFTASDRLKDFPTALSSKRIAQLQNGGGAAIAAAFPGLGPVAGLNSADGLRIAFENGEILHLRPSGNAPELRCYTEAQTPARASELNAWALAKLEAWRE
jgi:phosphomannomutase